MGFAWNALQDDAILRIDELLLDKATWAVWHNMSHMWQRKGERKKPCLDAFSWFSAFTQFPLDGTAQAVATVSFGDTSRMVFLSVVESCQIFACCWRLGSTTS